MRIDPDDVCYTVDDEFPADSRWPIEKVLLIALYNGQKFYVLDPGWKLADKIDALKRGYGEEQD